VKVVQVRRVAKEKAKQRRSLWRRQSDQKPEVEYEQKARADAVWASKKEKEKDKVSVAFQRRDLRCYILKNAQNPPGFARNRK
jgi:hypothetical protein